MISRLLIPAIALFALGSAAIAQGPGNPPKGKPANMVYKLTLGSSTFDIGSFQWGAGRGVAYQNGQYQTSQLSISEITITKELDANTGPIFNSLATFEAIPSGKIEGFLNGAAIPILSVEIWNVRLSSFSISAGTGFIPSESLSIHYRKIKINGYEFDLDNQAPLAAIQAQQMIAKIISEAIEKDAKTTR